MKRKNGTLKLRTRRTIHHDYKCGELCNAKQILLHPRLFRCNRKKLNCLQFCVYITLLPIWHHRICWEELGILSIRRCIRNLVKRCARGRTPCAAPRWIADKLISKSRIILIAKSAYFVRGSRQFLSLLFKSSSIFYLVFQTNIPRSMYDTFLYDLKVS